MLAELEALVMALAAAGQIEFAANLQCIVSACRRELRTIDESIANDMESMSFNGRLN